MASPLATPAVHAEIIAIGAELLLGEISDTNSAHIARVLREVGLEVWWISVVGDDEARIAELVDQARRRSALVITSGGLGPTVDDPTREAIARAFSRPLEYRPELWSQIQARFRRYGRTPTENNRKQAHVPAGARVLENPVGTAPCFAVEHEDGVVIALPGVPRELEYMLANAVVPYLREKFQLSGVIRAKVLRTVGLGESMIDEKIGELEKLSNPTVGLAAHAGQVDIRITAKAPTQAEAEAMIAPLEAYVRERLGEFVYGEDKATVEEVVVELLAERGMTVAVGEAGTGGHLGGRLALLSQAAQVFRGGTLASLDHASESSARQLAEAARNRPGQEADWGLGLVANPQADPIQLEIALAGPERTEVRALGYGGPPSSAAQWGSTAALNLLRLELLGWK